MSNVGKTQTTQYEKDCSQLRLLGATQFIIGAIFALITLICIPVLAVALMAVFMTLFASAPSSSVSNPFFLLLVSVIVVVIPGVLTWGCFYTGRCLLKHRSYHLCCIVMTIQTFGTGIGLVMGIWFAIVMNRQSVKDLFEANEKEFAIRKAEQKQLKQTTKPARQNTRKLRQQKNESLSGFREPERL